MTKGLDPRNKELIDDYIRACRLGRHGQRRVNSKRREDRIRCALNVFTRDFFQNQPVTEIGQKAVEEFFLKWKDGQYKFRRSKNSTREYAVSTLKSNWKIWKKFYAFINRWEPMEAPAWLRRLTIGDNDLIDVTPPSTATSTPPSSSLT